jgi:hypothetical protein
MRQQFFACATAGVLDGPAAILSATAVEQNRAFFQAREVG